MKVIILNSLILFTFLIVVPANAADSGLFYDSSSGQYFVNDKVSFAIKPLASEKYLDKVQYSLDNGPYLDYSGSIKLGSDGFHIVRFKAVDPVLNWSPTENFRIYVDLNKPTSHADWLGETYTDGHNLFVNENSRLVLSAQDDLSGVGNIFWKQIGDDKLQKYSNAKTFKEGVYQLEISAVDNVGNVEESKNIKFSVDGTLPTSTAKVTGNSYSKKGKVFFDKGSFVSLQAADGQSGVKRIEYKINDGPTMVYNKRISVSDIVTDIKFRSLDNVGNKESWKSLQVFLDATPPTLKLVNSGNYEKVAGKIFARAGFRIIASVTDNESGPQNLVINNERVNETKNKEIVFSSEGEHGLNLWAEDNVGNSANSVSYTVLVDESTPNTQIKASNQMVERDKTFISSLPNKLEFHASDDGVGVDFTEYSYDGKNYQRVGGPIDLATWQSPKRTIYYRSVDKLGNREDVKSMNVYVRKSGPLVDLFVEREGDFPSLPLSKLKMESSSKKRLPASKE